MRVIHRRSVGDVPTLPAYLLPPGHSTSTVGCLSRVIGTAGINPSINTTATPGVAFSTNSRCVSPFFAM